MRLTFWRCLVRICWKRLNILTVDFRSRAEFPKKMWVTSKTVFTETPQGLSSPISPSVRTASEARCCCTARYCERRSFKLGLHFALFGLVSRREEWKRSSDRECKRKQGKRKRTDYHQREIYWFRRLNFKGFLSISEDMWRMGSAYPVAFLLCITDCLLNLIFMDPCIVDHSVETPTRCNFVIEFIIPKFIKCSTCFERHTAHHKEL